MELAIYNEKGESVGKVGLPEKIFGQKPSKGFLHEAVTAYLANQRRGTAATKTRSEVSGGGRKPWKQKHTGRARAGSNRSPLWRKGGVVFGPQPRSYRQDFSRAKALMALGQALSAKNQAGGLKMVEAFDVQEAKTRQVTDLLKALGLDRGALVVMDQVSPKLKLASRNVPGLKLGRAADLHAYAVLNCRQLVLTRSGLQTLVGRYAEGQGA